MSKQLTFVTACCAALAGALIVAVASSHSGQAASSNTLLVSKLGTGTGTVTSSPGGINCGPTCAKGFPATATVTLIPAGGPNSTFAKWSGCTSVEGIYCKVAMTAYRNPQATFNVVQTSGYPLNVTVYGTRNGIVASSPAGISCQSTGGACNKVFALSTSVVLTATPSKGATFQSWAGCDSTKSNKCTVAMNRQKYVTATFY